MSVTTYTVEAFVEIMCNDSTDLLDEAHTSARTLIYICLDADNNFVDTTHHLIISHIAFSRSTFPLQTPWSCTI